MAKNVVKSHFSFARNFILAENTQLRSSPLREAAERFLQPVSDTKRIKTTTKNKPNNLLL